MRIKGVNFECFGDYKEIGMLIIFPYCSFKCDKESGCEVCQNSSLAKEPIIEVSTESLIQTYQSNPLTNALICGGLEPFDSPEDLRELLTAFRKASKDAIVIYTGYTEFEVQKIIDFEWLKSLGNLYIKYGRFKPNQSSHFDELLGVNLASENQYTVYYR